MRNNNLKVQTNSGLWLGRLLWFWGHTCQLWLIFGVIVLLKNKSSPQLHFSFTLQQDALKECPCVFCTVSSPLGLVAKIFQLHPLFSSCRFNVTGHIALFYVSVPSLQLYFREAVTAAVFLRASFLNRVTWISFCVLTDLLAQIFTCARLSQTLSSLEEDLQLCHALSIFIIHGTVIQEILGALDTLACISAYC